MSGQSNLRGGTADLFPADGATPQATDDRPSGGSGETQEEIALLASGETQLFQSRWEECQRRFVDEPRTSVQQADELVADVIRELANVFAEERSRLEEQWARGDEVSTEDLRLALQRYRSFFQRLLRAGG